jgi:hypothetical protein
MAQPPRQLPWGNDIDAGGARSHDRPKRLHIGAVIDDRGCQHRLLVSAPGTMRHRTTSIIMVDSPGLVPLLGVELAVKADLHVDYSVRVTWLFIVSAGITNNNRLIIRTAY